LLAILHLDAETKGAYEFSGVDVPVFVDPVKVNIPFEARFRPRTT